MCMLNLPLYVSSPGETVLCLLPTLSPLGISDPRAGKLTSSVTLSPSATFPISADGNPILTAVQSQESGLCFLPPALTHLSPDPKPMDFPSSSPPTQMGEVGSP